MRRLSILLFFTFVWQLNAQQSDFDAISFEKADNIAISLKGKGLNNLPLLAHNLTYTLETDAERFRAIYYWVCHNIKNDYDLMVTNDRKRRKLKDDLMLLNNWNKTFKKEVFHRLSKQKKTLCTGYAFLIRELATLAGLECEIINGYGKTSASFKSIKMPNHSWNAIKLNGKWYLCDATWSSGFIDDRYLFKFNYNDAFFLMAPEEFAKQHRPIDSEWLLFNKESN